MMNVPSASGWFGFIDGDSGDGVTTITGEVANFTSGIGTGSARRSWRRKMSPGETIVVSCFMRRISGSDATSGSLALDFNPTPGVLVNRVRVLSPEWQEYTLEYSAPLNSPTNTYVQISIGVFTGDGGEIEAMYPRIGIKNTPYGAMRTFGAGLIQIASGGVASINSNPGHVNFGIRNLSYSSPTLTITLDPIGTTIEAMPLFFGNLTTDNPSETGDLSLRFGNYNFTTGTVDCTFVSISGGTNVDISTFSNLFRFNFLAVI